MNQYLKIYRYGFLYGFPAGQFLLQTNGKTRYPLQDNGFLWSCYPDLNWGPHPYQLPWQYFLYIFRLFIAVFAPFHLLSDTLYKQGFRIFHACLWLVMWSETLAALEFSVLKQHCSRPRKWSNLNQAALNRLLTQRKYQAINCTSVYNDKQIS